MSTVDLHLVQSFPPSCLNRDEHGMPKSANYGGRERARFSSQCQKRSRKQFMKNNGSSISIRSRGIPTMIRDLLMGNTEDLSFTEGPEGRQKVTVTEKPGRDQKAIERAIEAAYKVIGQKIVLSEEKNGMNLEHQFANSREEIDRLTAAIDKHFDILSNITIPEDDDSKSRKRNNKKATASVPPEVQKEIQACFDREGETHQAVDNILFGRMIAEDPTLNIEGCCQWAHAISTHEVIADLDSFVAVDDLGYCPTDMMDTVGYNSPTIYQYANMDVASFFQKMNGRAEIEFRRYHEAVVKALPTGKQNSFAAQNPPSFVMAVNRKAWPWSLANAFIPAVKSEDIIRASIEALGSFFGSFCDLYGTKDIVGAIYFSNLKEIKIPYATRIATLDEWIDKLWEMVKPEYLAIQKGKA